MKPVQKVYYEDVEVGMGLPTLVKGPYAVMEMAKFGAMIGDFYPTHYDHKWATEIDKVPGVVVYGLKIATHLSQLVTDWITPDGILRRFGNRVVSQLYVGEKMLLKGTVIRKYAENGEYRVDCRIWGEKEDGKLVVEGHASVALPLREP
jgi:hydroxyacyl-ACP dehydratase HTD2-like protein with hotdog domain